MKTGSNSLLRLYKQVLFGSVIRFDHRRHLFKLDGGDGFFTDIGQIAAGKCCDLFLVDAGRLELVGSLADPKSVLATVGLRGAVDYTVVNGRVVVEHGRLAATDEERLAREANEKCKAYLSL